MKRKNRPHGNGEDNIHHLVHIERDAASLLRIVLLHLHHHDLDHGARLDETVQIQESRMVDVEVREHQRHDGLGELIAEADESIGELLKLHATRAIRVEVVEHTLGVKTVIRSNRPLGDLSYDGIELVEIDSSASISVMLQKKLVAQVHGNAQSRHFKRIAQLLACDVGPRHHAKSRIQPLLANRIEGRMRIDGVRTLTRSGSSVRKRGRILRIAHYE